LNVHHPVRVTTAGTAGAIIAAAMSTRTLPRHNPPTPKGVPGGQIIAVALLLTFSLFPRAFILGFWIFSDQIGNAFSSWIIPALGFVILPWTTLLYAWMWAISSDGVNGWEWILVGVAFILDISFWIGLRKIFR
jgi:hypothetical protein